jgi:hypothetical protein
MNGIPKLLGVVVVLCTSALVADLRAAQGRQAVPPGAQGRLQGRAGADPAAVSPAEIQRMLDGYVLIQAQEMLQLSDEQFPRFLSRLQALQQLRRRTQGERQRALQELRRMTQARGGSIDENVIGNRLKALDDLDTRSAAEIRQAQEAIDQVLTPHQQARFRVFEENMEQRKLELLMRARQASRGRQFQP